MAQSVAPCHRAPVSYTHLDVYKRQRLNIDGTGVSRLAETAIDGVLAANKAVVVTIVLAPTETSVYLDGVPIGKSRIDGMVTGGFAGRLILANALTASDSWSGKRCV